MIYISFLKLVKNSKISTKISTIKNTLSWIWDYISLKFWSDWTSSLGGDPGQKLGGRTKIIRIIIAKNFFSTQEEQW